MKIKPESAGRSLGHGVRPRDQRGIWLKFQYASSPRQKFLRTIDSMAFLGIMVRHLRHEGTVFGYA
jgi:hypothetical protein